jgi:hypothetical protein
MRWAFEGGPPTPLAFLLDDFLPSSSSLLLRESISRNRFGQNLPIKPDLVKLKLVNTTLYG